MSQEEARLVAELGRALGHDPQPPGLVERANGLLAFADFDRQLAQLLETSSGELVGTRGLAATHAGAMRFEVADGSVVVEVSVARGRIEAQVIAGTIAEVVLERVSGPDARATVDELGRFGFVQSGAGPVRLILRGTGSEPVATDWFLP